MTNTEIVTPQIIPRRPLELPDKALEEIVEAESLSRPNETGGLLFPAPVNDSWIHILQNIAPDPTNMLRFNKDEFISVAQQWVSSGGRWEDITIWHTHPGGGIGPSRMDMKARIAQMGNLVIAFTEDGQVIPTWF